MNTAIVEKKFDEQALPHGFIVDGNHICKASSSEKGKGKIVTRGIFKVSSIITNTDEHDCAREIKVVNKAGKVTPLVIQNREFFDQQKLKMKLADYGVMVKSSGALIDYIEGFPEGSLDTKKLVTNIGWQGEEGDMVFALPNQVISADGVNDDIVFSSAQNINQRGWEQQGSLQDWNENVLSYARHHPLAFFSILVGLSGPLQSLASQESGGFHIFAFTSSGKTISLTAAASVYGRGTDSSCDTNSLLNRWNGSANGHEAKMTAYSDTVLLQDELGTFSGRLSDVLYGMQSGLGKSTMTVERTYRAENTWRITTLSTGEMSVKDRLASEGSHDEGLINRMVDIDWAAYRERFELTLEDVPYKEVQKNCALYYGSAGSAFIEALIKNYGTYENAREKIRERMVQAVSVIQGNIELKPHEERVLKRFALLQVAGELACELNIFSEVEKEEIHDIVGVAWDVWFEGSFFVSAGEKLAHKLAKKLYANKPKVQKSRTAGFGYSGHCIGFMEKGQCYLHLDAVDNMVGEGKTKKLIDWLKREDLLEYETTRGYKRIMHNGLRTPFYVLKSEFFSREFDG